MIFFEVWSAVSVLVIGLWNLAKYLVVRQGQRGPLRDDLRRPRAVSAPVAGAVGPV